MISAGDHDHLDHSAFISGRQVALEREVNDVAEGAARHQVLDTITANQNFVRHDSRKGSSPEGLTHYLINPLD
jgi:hypothetical protein